MNQGESDFEENLKRLLKASCGPAVAVTPLARERLRAELAAMRLHPPQPVEFPPTALGFLAILLVALWGAGMTAGWLRPSGWHLNGPVLALTCLNLVCIPVASLVIILRRKYA